MKNKQFLLIVMLGAFLFPSITFASWWNPFTWNLFKKKEQVQLVNKLEVQKPEDKQVDEPIVQKNQVPIMVSKMEQKTIKKNESKPAIISPVNVEREVSREDILKQCEQWGRLAINMSPNPLRDDLRKNRKDNNCPTYCEGAQCMP